MGKFENLINARHRLCETTNPAANDPHAQTQPPQTQTPTAAAAQPTAAQPTAAQPTAAQPTATQPAAAQPAAAQPTAAQPTGQETVDQTALGKAVSGIQMMIKNDPQSKALVGAAAEGDVSPGFMRSLGLTDKNLAIEAAKQAIAPQQ